MERTSSRLPRQKQIVTSITKPSVPLNTAVASMILGMVFEAFLTSSDICTAASGPMSESVGPRIPTNVASPTLPQPPPSLNSRKTARDEEGVARVQSGTSIAINPRMWRTNTVPWIEGRNRAKTVLIDREKKTSRIAIKVPCHL